ncbi:hypothetical protein [Helicobacter rodentium]|uniref:hypothetical protein n=1 Tax=Helicobacter rodentium TaxID=59617 RepID=UPI002612E46A|nr:hypothetical protein [Helicobacter rodentium]
MINFPKTLKILSFIIIPPLFVFIYFFGWGWLVPYELQPSYWEFKKMCELSFLPYNEDSYNKILSYYGKKLGDIDDFSVEAKYKGENYFVASKNIGKRVEIDLYIAYKNKENKKFSFDNIEAIFLFPTWKTYRPIFYGNEGNMEITWDLENEISCGNLDIIKQKIKEYQDKNEE